MSATPTVSGHVRERWLDRSSAPSLEPAVLWERGVSVPADEFDAEEARYLPAADVIVIRRGATLSTALEPDVYEPAARAAIEDQEAHR